MIVAATLALHLHEDVHVDLYLDLAAVLEAKCLKRRAFSDELLGLCTTALCQSICGIFLFILFLIAIFLLIFLLISLWWLRCLIGLDQEKARCTHLLDAQVL